MNGIIRVFASMSKQYSPADSYAFYGLPPMAALVICRSCYRALTERTVSMDVEKIVKELRRYGLGNGTALGRHMGIMDEAADKLEELNDFEQSQCAKVLAQLAAAVEFIRHLDREYSHYIADPGFEQWRGEQEAGEVEHGD